MAKYDQPNPIYQRLTRHTRGLSTWLIIGVAVGIGAVVLVMSLILPNHHNIDLVLLILPLVGIFAAISPVVMAVYAALLAAKDQHEENLQMMKLAGITKAVMIMGYTEAAFHRLRFMAAVAAALIPTLVIAGFARPDSPLLVDANPSNVSQSDAVIWQLTLLPVMVLLSVAAYFFHTLGSFFGALMGVWWKQPILALVSVILIMLILQMVSLFAGLFISLNLIIYTYLFLSVLTGGLTRIAQFII